MGVSRKFSIRRILSCVGLSGLAMLAGLRGTQDAVANGETRSLSLYHAHTQESLTVTFRRDGAYVEDALKKLNWFLRDWRKDEPTAMAPTLFDVLWHVYREAGASEPIKVVSAYRAPDTNAMLRRRSRAVAKDSHHTRGNAMDVHIPGVSMAKVREFAMRLHAGGVGYYPSAGSPFVHVDVGNVRSWPRMSRDQLERLFPDGKTVHLPADGTPLSNYQAALAEVQARGGRALDYATVTTTRGPSLWALLFGGDADEDKAEAARPGRRGTARAASSQQNAPQVAALPSNAEDRAIIVPPQPGALAFRQEPTHPVIAAAPIAPGPVPLQPESPPDAKAEAVPLPPIRPKGFGIIAPVEIADGITPPIRFAGLRPLEAPSAPVVAAPVTPPEPPPSPVATSVNDGLVPPLRLARAVPPAAPVPPALSPVSVRTTIAPEARKALTSLIADAALRDARPDHVVNVRAPEVDQERKREILASSLKGGKRSEHNPSFTGGFIRPIGARFMRDKAD